MRKRIKALKAAILDSEDLAALRTENDLLQQELDHCVEINNDLLDQLKGAQTQIERLTVLNDELNQKVKGLKKKLKPRVVVEEKFSKLIDFWD
jgi:hypothetical protein